MSASSKTESSTSARSSVGVPARPSQPPATQAYIPTVLPLLEAALSQMVIEQPNDPCAFLAQYFLARSRNASSEVGSVKNSLVALSAQILQSGVGEGASERSKDAEIEDLAEILSTVSASGSHTQSHRNVGLNNLPDALLLSIANTWLNDRETAALARVDWSRLRNLRKYLLKIPMSLAQAVRLEGFDVSKEQLDLIIDEEDERSKQTAAMHARNALMASNNSPVPLLSDSFFAASNSSSSVIVEKRLTSEDYMPKVAASTTRKYSFGTTERVFIDSQLDAASLPLLKQLPRVRDVILGKVMRESQQPFTSLAPPTGTSPSISLLSLEYLAKYLPPSVTRLGPDRPSYHSCTLHLCVSSPAVLASIHLPPSLLELVLPMINLDSATAKLSDFRTHNPQTAPLERLTLPSGLKALICRPNSCYDWEPYFRGLRLPSDLRVLRIYLQAGDPESPPSLPLAGLVLPSQLEELMLQVSEGLIKPIDTLRLPDSLLKLRMSDVSTLKGLKLPPRLQSFSVSQGESRTKTPLRLADLNPLPASLTCLEADGQFYNQIRVNIEGVILPSNLKVFNVDFQRSALLHPGDFFDLQSVFNSLTEMKHVVANGDQFKFFSKMQELQLSSSCNLITALPPNLTRLYLERPSALANFQLPETLQELFVRAYSAHEYGDHPLLLPKTWPSRLKVINYQSDANSIRDLPLHLWTPPNSVTSLTFASWPPDLSLHQVRWPSQLVHLSIGRIHSSPGRSYYHQFTPLPDHSKRRAFLAPPAEQPHNWPDSLTSLHLLNGYSEAMAEGYLPPNLRELHLSVDWNALPADTYFPPTLTSLVFGAPEVKSQGNSGFSAFARPLVELLAALPDGLKELRIFYEHPLPPGFGFSPEIVKAVGEDLIRTVQGKMDAICKLPSSLVRLHLQSKEHLTDGWDKLLLDRPQCGTFFAESK